MISIPFNYPKKIQEEVVLKPEPNEDSRIGCFLNFLQRGAIEFIPYAEQ